MGKENTVREKIENLPAKPGVYLMKDSSGEIIYVGKAKNLRSRVRSYFRKQTDSPKTAVLVGRINDLEWIITDSETEALVLECNLIKEHRPKYNVMLIDDKHYPYVKVTIGEEYPRVQVVRRRGNDNARYFGPYTSSGDLNEVLKIIRELFQLRTCSNSRFRNRRRPCLNYQIKKCEAPCVGRVSRKDYLKQIDEIILLLEGKTERLLDLLQERMQEASQELNYEKAARLRDQREAIERITSKQKVVTDRFDDRDILALAAGEKQSCGQIFFVRSGKVIGRDQYPLYRTGNMEESEIMGAFIKQYYSGARDIPGELLVAVDPEEKELLEKWLSELRGKKVRIHCPQRGENRRLADMVAENARLGYMDQEIKEHKEIRESRALEELGKALEMKYIPDRIECYDISNTGGTHTVASMVVFEEGKPVRSQYRRFRIRTVEGPDDFASMKEVLQRRFRTKNRGDDSFDRWPNLVIIDGGKGQLTSALQAMKSRDAGNIAVAGLAKKEELLYIEDRKEPVVLPIDSEARYLVQRIRDEAHRFAITYHRKLRGQAAVTSVLDSVPGIGPKRKKALLQAFGTPAGVSRASAEEIAGVLGISVERAEIMKEHLG